MKKTSRKLNKNLLCTICATILLSGCSYFDTGEEEVNLDTPQSESADMMATREPIENVDIMSLVNQSSDPSVQVYSLDGAPGPDKFSARDVNRAPSRSVISSNPSVQVFPLDEDMRGATPSSLMPAAPASSGPIEMAPVSDELSAAPVGTGAQIFFDHDSDTVNGEGKATIAALAQKFSGGQGVSVEGHASVKANFADEVQRKIVNLRVSMNRALAVAKELISGGVPADSIRTVAWGDSKPPIAVPGKDAEEAARRVEVYAAHQ